MKRETLFRRISEKAGSPELLRVLTGQMTVEDLPSSCMIWTGSHSQAGRHPTKDRDAKNIPVSYVVNRRPFGVMRVQGKSEYVHRLVYKLLFNPEFDFRMTNRCGNTLCCHPKHWEVDMPTPDYDFDSDSWQLDEAMEAVEAMLGRYTVLCWEDVKANPLMQDIPEAMIRKCLTMLKKEHLLQ